MNEYYYELGCTIMILIIKIIIMNLMTTTSRRSLYNEYDVKK